MVEGESGDENERRKHTNGFADTSFPGVTSCGFEVNSPSSLADRDSEAMMLVCAVGEHNEEGR